MGLGLLGIKKYQQRAGQNIAPDRFDVCNPVNGFFELVPHDFMPVNGEDLEPDPSGLSVVNDFVIWHQRHLGAVKRLKMTVSGTQHDRQHQSGNDVAANADE